MKTALLFGSTGLVGGHVLNQLIQNNNYSKIKIFVRSSTEINDSKIEVIKIDFNNLDKYAEDLLGMKFKPARDSIKDAGNSVIRLGLI